MERLKGDIKEPHGIYKSPIQSSDLLQVFTNYIGDEPSLVFFYPTPWQRWESYFIKISFWFSFVHSGNDHTFNESSRGTPFSRLYAVFHCKSSSILLNKCGVGQLLQYFFWNMMRLLVGLTWGLLCRLDEMVSMFF